MNLYFENFEKHTQNLFSLDIPKEVKTGFALELTHMQCLKHDAMIEETHGNGEKARQLHADADSRLYFMLGMLDTLRSLDRISDEDDEKLVEMIYHTNRMYSCVA